jgi:hypothetical protein
MIVDEELEAPLDDLEAYEEPDDAQLGDAASSSGASYNGSGQSSN